MSFLDGVESNGVESRILRSSDKKVSIEWPIMLCFFVWKLGSSPLSLFGGDLIHNSLDDTSLVHILLKQKMSAEDMDEAVCRVCHGESEDDHMLFHPCKCSGSIKYVHQDCLMVSDAYQYILSLLQ